MGAEQIHPGERELRRAFKANPSRDTFAPLIDGYLAFVYTAACRQLGQESAAAEATLAVFLSLANQARRIRRRTPLAEWLFRATRIAAKKLLRARKAPPANEAKPEPPPDADADRELWGRIAPGIDDALDHLSSKLRNALLLRVFLRREDAPEVLRARERRLAKRVQQGLRKLARRLRKRAGLIDPEMLAQACGDEGCATRPPEGLAVEILAASEECFKRRPKLALAKRALRGLAWDRWKRRLKFAAVSLASMVLMSAAIAGGLAWLWHTGYLLPLVMEWSVRSQAWFTPEIAQPARPWPADAGYPLANARAVRATEDLYRLTNIWPAHLKFTAQQWQAASPKRIAPLPQLFQPGGAMQLRNPKARRSGLAGALGFDFEWTPAEFEFGGISFANTAARMRGNGTFLSSLYDWKRPFKVDLDKFSKGRRLGGTAVLNFANLIADSSCVRDALGYEFFRDTGCPAPRTAYAWLAISVAGRWDRHPLGLYLLVENIDAAFAAECFGSRRTPIFKPVTYELFQDLGDDWAAYADIYDLKTKATDEERRRVVKFARLVTRADDARFAREVGAFLDLDEFARFLTGLVLLASYDGFLSDGQNFYLYLDPRSNRFGFIPWDLDAAWGGFPFVGIPTTREQASIWHPWASRNRFLERVMAVPEFRRLYRARLEEMLATVFQPERLLRRVDALAAVLRGPIAAESDYRLRRFDQAVSGQWLPGDRDQARQGPRQPPHQIKRFIINRAASVRAQLDGVSEGVVLHFGQADHRPPGNSPRKPE